METLTIPKFENETDEANWLYENRDGLANAFLQAAQEGRVRQGTLRQRGITPPTTIRLAPEDISRARPLAERLPQDADSRGIGEGRTSGQLSTAPRHRERAQEAEEPAACLHRGKGRRTENL